MTAVDMKKRKEKTPQENNCAQLQDDTTKKQCNAKYLQAVNVAGEEYAAVQYQYGASEQHRSGGCNHGNDDRQDDPNTNDAVDEVRAANDLHIYYFCYCYLYCCSDCVINTASDHWL